MFTINCKGKLLTLHTPLVMGIINATEDSFYRGDLQYGPEAIVALARKMMDDGATFIDIGGQSTRPGAERISAKTEMDRVLPILKKINEQVPEAIISIDTFYSEVAAEAVAAGASMVNDVSGGEMDENMIATVAALKVPYVCMHMKGTSQTMQQYNQYDDLLKEVLDYFIQKKSTCVAAGINDVIIDPGFGFAKNPSQNFQLLKQLSLLKMLDCPILAGLSRKSTVYKTLGITAAEALNGSSVLHTIALQNGANILRVHDVKEAVEAVKLVSAYNEA